MSKTPAKDTVRTLSGQGNVNGLVMRVSLNKDTDNTEQRRLILKAINKHLKMLQDQNNCEQIEIDINHIYRLMSAA